MKIKDHYSEELQAFAAEYLRFDFVSGKIYWKKNRYGGCSVGQRAGTIHTDKRRCNKPAYRNVKICGKLYFEHRILYCFFHRSSFSGFEIDHIDQNPLNNKMENLRAVTQTNNSRNRSIPSNNKSGQIGVSFRKELQKWRAFISVDGKRIHLGCFTKKRDAIFRRKLAEIHYGYHPNHGRAKNQN